jgi:hypothetical protein
MDPAPAEPEDLEPLIVERDGLRLVPSGERVDPPEGSRECGQRFELVDEEDGARFSVSFSHIFGADDNADDEADIAPPLEIPEDATLRLRFVSERPWRAGPTLVLEDEEGILVAGQSGGLPGDFEGSARLEVEESGDSLPYFDSCGTVTQHRLRFAADTAVELEVGETATITASGVDLDVRSVHAQSLEYNGNCTDTTSGTWRSWLAVRR